jgi:lysozyme
VRDVPQQALDLVKASEGFRASRNTDPTGNPEIGYGHKLTPVDPFWNAVLSEEGAAALAMDDLDHVASELETLLGSALIDNLTVGRWAALLDFVYNVGIGRFQTSTLCQKIRTGQLISAGCEFPRWVYGKDPVTEKEVVLPGLVRRRAAELSLWQG